MCPDLAALFQHADAYFPALFLGQLLEPNGGGQPRDAGADDDDVIFHRFALAHLRSLYRALPSSGPECTAHSLTEPSTFDDRRPMGGEMQAIADERGRAAAGSLLGWWLESGIDVAVGESPRDWLGQSKAPAAQPKPVAPSGEKPSDLASFRAWLATASGLPMDRTGAIRVPAHGPECAKAMLLSDLPAREDVAEGKPIGGDAWALTTGMLAAIGLGQDDAYVASLSPFHAPGARFNGDLEACGEIARDH